MWLLFVVAIGRGGQTAGAAFGGEELQQLLPRGQSSSWHLDSILYYAVWLGDSTISLNLAALIRVHMSYCGNLLGRKNHTEQTKQDKRAAWLERHRSDSARVGPVCESACVINQD